MVKFVDNILNKLNMRLMWHVNTGTNTGQFCFEKWLGVLIKHMRSGNLGLSWGKKKLEMVLLRKY